MEMKTEFKCIPTYKGNTEPDTVQKQKAKDNERHRDPLLWQNIPTK